MELRSTREEIILKFHFRVTLDLNEGQVEGRHYGNKYYEVFRSIPFAKPPVNARRWAPPEPIKNFDAKIDGTRLARMCHSEMIYIGYILRFNVINYYE